MPTKAKTIEYRFVQRLHPYHFMEGLVQEAWEALPSTTERTFNLPDGSSVRGLSCRHFEGGGFAIHIVNYTDRQSVGVVPMDDANSAELDERDPDAGTNFLSSDILAIFLGDHVVTMNSRINSSKLHIFICKLFEAAGLEALATQFAIKRRSDTDKIAMISRHGVKRIDIKVGLQEATVERILELNSSPNPFQKIRAKALEAVAAIAQTDEEGDLRDSEKGFVTLGINVPKGDLAPAKDDIAEIATLALNEENNEDDTFVILLGNGEEIRSNQIVMKSIIRVEKHANTVQTADAWRKMHGYISGLMVERQDEI